MSVVISKDKWFIPKGERKPIIECPICGGSLLGDSSPHIISQEGKVTASVVCRHINCTFHDFVTLEDWNGGTVLNVKM